MRDGWNRLADYGATVVSFFLLGLSVLASSHPPRTSSAPMIWAALALGGLLLAGLIVRSLRHHHHHHPSPLLGIWVLAEILTVCAFTGGAATSPLHPLVFVWISAVSGLFPSRAMLATLATALGFEVVIYAISPGQSFLVLLANVGFLIVFAALFRKLMGREVDVLRRRGSEAVEEALSQIEQDARDFRILEEPGETEDEIRPSSGNLQSIRCVGSVGSIREAVLDVLGVARLAVCADRVLLFMLDSNSDTLKLKSSVGADVPGFIEGPFPAHEGALGAVVRTGRSVFLLPRSGTERLGYRSKNEVPVGSFLGVPLVKDDRVLGVLAVDRRQSSTFTEADETVLTSLAREVLRVLESEHVLVAMDRLKYEQERFHDAFALLNEVLSSSGFPDRLLKAAHRIKPTDFLAVTSFDAEQALHTITGLRCVDPALEKRLSGACFKHGNGGLVAMALKTGQILPYRPLSLQAHPSPQMLFGELESITLASVKVFPLRARNEPLGTLVVGSTRVGEDLTREEERLFQTVSTHAATTLANALMFDRMERMATRDGLTGLTNHRRFKELVEEALARGRRFGRKVSVVMIDADHFKNVNDTYGHPVGDLVLKRLAALLTEAARRTDVVARYGGEEFSLALDETDAQGAWALAERIRARIETEEVQGEFGRLRVTASFGVATWPDNADSVEQLLEKADQALYEAKRAGRNRVVVWQKGAKRCPRPLETAIRERRAGPSGLPQVQA